MKIFTVAALVAAQASAGDTKCHALVLSGGGTNGAWEAGVIWGLTHYGQPSDFFWDVVTGVSAGSVNTIGQVGFEPSDTVAATEYLSNTWASMLNKQVYREWGDHHGILGLVPSCLENVSCFDDKYMLEFLQDELQQFKEVKRRFTVNAVDVNTGEYVSFNQTNLEFEEIPQAAVSSSSIPGVFPPQHFKGHLLMDGGTVWDIDAFSAVEQCLDIVDDVTDVIVDVLMCSPHTTPSEEKKPSHNSMYDLFRGHAIKKYYSNSNSISNAKR